jgi:predicted  nucleic acid-binding Zn-ribbon protein
MPQDLEWALQRIEHLERALEHEGRRRKQVELTLRKRGGDAVIAEAEANHLRAQLVHGHEEERGRLQAKCELQRREIVRLSKEVAELQGALQEARRSLREAKGSAAKGSGATPRPIGRARK